jgi:hypothetical protein
MTRNTLRDAKASSGHSVVSRKARGLSERFLYSGYSAYLCRMWRADTSGLEPLTCPSYEFAPEHPSPSWRVRKSACLGGLGNLGCCFVRCVPACTSPVAIRFRAGLTAMSVAALCIRVTDDGIPLR